MFKYYNVEIKSNKKAGDSVTSISKTFKSLTEANSWISKAQSNSIVEFLGGINCIVLTVESYKEDKDGRLIQTMISKDFVYLP